MGIALAYPILPAHGLLPMLGAGAPVALVSFLDDRYNLPARHRFAVHAFSAALLVWFGLSPQLITLPGLELELAWWLGAGFSVLFIVWMINLYNFMDGMDGLAGGMAVFGFGGLAALGWLAGDVPFAVANTVIAAAAAGFLVFNFPPASIFMGDVGSSTLGFWAAALSLWGRQRGLFPLWIALLLFSPFIVDATITMMRRLLRGEKVWLPHKTHYYQRLVELGWGHRRTVLWEYALMLGAMASALLAFGAPVWLQWALIAGWTATYVILAAGVRRLEATIQGRGSR